MVNIIITSRRSVSMGRPEYIFAKLCIVEVELVFSKVRVRV